ncbi:LLM class flavin-dependent oxidoreductase [Mesorhizobium delmotii]|uniref:Putative monooxygenase YxeK n=1 Tax=Mesorhizobium delmotii TaxID=1631247 RepID=A0A2P9AMY7_9HYPH|nr:LLM class flavin-dependent oxidoreductase [Mesorhizobium delmotii]SJM32521.1 putative monooxygenase YxeK [Mesorhizobium delmotii]
MSADQMALGAFLRPGGHHEAGWRHLNAHSDAGANIERYISYAAKAEAAALHFVFVADSAGVRESTTGAMSRSGRIDGFEPTTLLAALAMTTKSIGLVGTASTTFNEPYHLARVFASIDHLSRGRVGWNIVTSSNPFEAQNFKMQALPSHEERYQRAAEFMEVVEGLWDSWADDAFIRERESGLYFDPQRMNFLNHNGKYFAVRGPLNVSRPPQGYPVLAQAGSSPTGARFAGQYGELVFTAQQNIEDAKAFYKSVKGFARDRGRSDADLLVMPGIVPIVAPTAEEAEEKLHTFQSLIHEDVALELAKRLLGYVIDVDKRSLDDPVPDGLGETNNMQSRQKLLIETAKKKHFTIRQLAALLSIGRGHLVCVGSPTGIVDQMEQFFIDGAADGFIIMPPMFPDSLDDFVQLAIPELRRRGLFRRNYNGTTLRENLGLTRPANDRTNQMGNKPAAPAV